MHLLSALQSHGGPYILVSWKFLLYILRLEEAECTRVSSACANVLTQPSIGSFVSVMLDRNVYDGGIEELHEGCERNCGREQPWTYPFGFRAQ
jgi:hypothetical protein